MRLAELILKLPSNLEHPEIVEPHEALDVASTRQSGYIAPTFTVHDWPSNAPVLLIEAAGAVGKSTSAIALSDALKWPLIRTERAQVGSYSLSGLLQDALGYSGDYIPRMVSGTTGVVIDSLDEANLRAGTDNFLAFLDNVQRVSGGENLPEKRNPSIVLFSRADAAELIRLSFLNADIPLAHLSLDFFDYEGAQSFISSYLRERFQETKRGEYNIALSSPKPFGRMRDERLSHIASVLMRRPVDKLSAAWSSVSDFLGYAPVLVAIAESLAVTNPAAEKAKLQSHDASRLLNEIMDHITYREQKKFSDQIWSKLYAGLPAVEDEFHLERSTLYTPLEQVTRLAGRVNGNPIVLPLPFELPTSVRSAYEEAVALFLAEHPFLKGKSYASVVFSDYVNAASVNDDTTISLARPVYAEITSTGPFFARFLHGKTSAGEVRSVPASLVEPIMSSWTEEANLAGLGSSGSFIAINGTFGVIQCWRESEDPSQNLLEFDLDDLPAENIVLQDNLRQTVVATDRQLVLGRRGQRFALGPQVVLVADSITIDAEVLQVRGGVAWESGAVLSSDFISANYLTKIEGAPDALAVHTADPPPRLRPYIRELSAGEKTVHYARLIDLRSVLMAFKSSTKGLSFLVSHMDQRVVRGNEIRQQILDHLIETNAVYRDGSWLLLDLKRLGTFGFGLNELRAGVPTEAVVAFLANCGVE